MLELLKDNARSGLVLSSRTAVRTAATCSNRAEHQAAWVLLWCGVNLAAEAARAAERHGEVALAAACWQLEGRIKGVAARYLADITGSIALLRGLAEECGTAGVAGDLAVLEASA